MEKQGTVTIYGCGGTGCNINSLFEDMSRQPAKPGYANVKLCYIDSSDSDIGKNIDKSNVFLIEGVDGAGGWRGEHNEVIEECVPAILHKHKPSEQNIVISSGSGGTGPVAAYHLTEALVAAGKSVIVFTVGTIETILEINNTIKHLFSLENIVDSSKKPLVLSYWQNDVVTNDTAVNNGIKTQIDSLLVLMSRQHGGLDTMDINNWLHYNNKGINDVPSKLVSLDIFTGDQIHSGTDLDILTVATLYRVGMDTSPGFAYSQALGRVSDEVNDVLKLTQPLHFCLVDGYIAKIHTQLAKEKKMFTEHRRAIRRSETVDRTIIEGADKVKKILI